ncbi:MAG: anhydro-N-acetylmuramic acid kinase [Thermoguttaceae bacterium]
MRHFVGLSVNTSGHRLESAVIAVHGEGGGAPLEVCQSIAFDLPQEIERWSNELCHYQHALASHCGHQRNAVEGIDMLLANFLAHELASLKHEAISEIIGDAALAPADVLAVGVHDAGMRYYQSFGMGYHSLCDAPQLASVSGHNVVDAFPLADMVRGGDGKSTLAMPLWVMLRNETQDRIILDLGRTAKVAFLPKSTTFRAHEQIVYRDVIACGSLLDLLTSELTHGELTIDTGGRETVQGCLVPELLELWKPLREKTILYGLVGAVATPYRDILKEHHPEGWSLRDTLCTATHAITGAILEACRDFSDTAEIIITGGCRQHGMLLHQLTTAFAGRQLVPLTQLGLTEGTLDAVCTAILTLMAVDQMPSNLPHVSGAATSVSLGRLTPGSPAQWQRLLQTMAQITPAVRPLRSAV